MPESLRGRLVRREPLLGTLITLPSSEAAEICADAGFDWLFLDMEHGALDLSAVQRIAQSVGERCPCVVRVPANERLWLTKVLDIGVAGVIIPQVNSAVEAERAHSYSKYPPLGTRSVGIARAHGYGAALAEYLARANDETALIVQVEHITGVENVDAIAAVKGIDAILIGPFDLSASMGKPGKIASPDVQAAIARVRQVVAQRGIPLGIFCPTIESAIQALAENYSFIPVASDTLVLVRGMQDIVRLVNDAKGARHVHIRPDSQ